MSEANNGATYESLSDALTVANDILKPEQKKGGMTIKYVQSSDNNYVSYMYKLEYANTTAGNTAFVKVANWEKINLEEEVRQLSQEAKCKTLNELLRSYSNVEITSDLLSTLIWDGTAIVESNSASRSLIIKIDQTATYTWNVDRRVFGFDDYPKVGDVPTFIGIAQTISNLSDYKYVLVNLVNVGDIFMYSKNIVAVNGLADIHRLLDAEFTKTDLLSGATIKSGYYNGNTGAYIAASGYSSIEVAVDNSVDLNKVFVQIKVGQYGTQLVPWIIFYNGGTVIGTFIGNVLGTQVCQIPLGTTRIAFNLLQNYSSQRGDEIFMISDNSLQHVAGTIASIKTKDARQDEQIEELQELVGQLEYYSDYIDVDKTTTANRIAIWIDKANNIQSNQYEIKIDFTHPNGVTSFILFKATTAHGGLESLGSFQVGKTYTITKDSAKPVLYIYNNSVAETQVDPYNVNILMYVVNKNGIKYQSSLLYGNSLANKKIVVFGDSLSEFTDANGKSWSQHLHELTNAQVVNLAIGGTQLRQRRELIKAFSEDITINVGEWVFNKPSGETKMNCYECITQHTGTWDSSHFVEITYSSLIYSTLDIVNMVYASTDVDIPIESRFNNQIAAAQCVRDHYKDNNTSIVARMSDVNWASVDAVVILGGTNDYGDIGRMGTTGSTDKNKTLGAINEIARMLCSTYKQLSVYYVTPVVHWKDYSSGVGLPENWCDNYNPSAMGMTRGTYYKQLQEEFLKNHIPGLNLYYELGWNIYNFSDYFYSDGTHPTKGLGFYMMAKKISSFLAGNKAF